MTFTFDADTISTATLTFNVPNGPEIAFLQLFSQAANQQLNGATTNKVDIWQNSNGLVLERVETNDRFTRYRFKYATQGGIDDFDIIFTKDVAGIYNFRLNSEGNFGEEPLEIGLLKVRNVLPTAEPNKTRYISQNEENSNYVFLTNNSI